MINYEDNKKLYETLTFYKNIKIKINVNPFLKFNWNNLIQF